MPRKTGAIYDPIPPDRAYEWVGKTVHVAWAKNSCVWFLEGIVDGKWAHLRTPKTGRKLVVLVKDLRQLSPMTLSKHEKR